MWRKLAGLACTAVGCLTLVGPVSAHEGDRIVRTVRAGGKHVRLTTHGDPRAAFAAPAAGPAQGGGAPRAGLATQLCGLTGPVDDTSHATDLLRPIYKVVYAYPSDQPSRLAQYGGTFADLVGASAATFSRGSADRLELRVDRGTSCGADFLDLAEVRLPRTLAQYEALGKSGVYDAVAADVKGALTGLPAGQRRNLLVFADYVGPTADAGGQATRWSDDRPGSENLANDGGVQALVYGWGREWFVASSRQAAVDVVVHELLHNLGAVQDSAPHSTLTSHCFDEWDIECYADDGPRGTSSWLTFNCPGGPEVQALDCGEDDYFSRSPAAGSYLDVRWNAARSLFLCRAERCDTAPQAPTAHVSTGAPAPDGTVVLDGRASSDPDGALAAWRWANERGLDLVSDPRRPAVQARVPAPGTYRVRLTVTDDEGIDTTAVSDVTVGAFPGSQAGPGNAGVGNVPVGTAPATTRAPARHCRVPRLRGVRLTTALRRLRRAGCRVGYRRLRGVPRRRLRVRSSTPRAGTEVRYGYRVRLRLRRT
jgi:PKD domain